MSVDGISLLSSTYPAGSYTGLSSTGSTTTTAAPSTSIQYAQDSVELTSDAALVQSLPQMSVSSATGLGSTSDIMSAVQNSYLAQENLLQSGVSSQVQSVAGQAGAPSSSIESLVGSDAVSQEIASSNILETNPAALQSLMQNYVQQPTNDLGSLLNTLA